MRLSITLFMLSAASIVIARCGICPEEIKEHEVVYDLLLNDADSNETFCGYEERGEAENKDQGYCVYNGKGLLISSSDLTCPPGIATEECVEDAQN
ncbi:hypothetical protein B0H13DRAFT_1176511 [Mycena leptocephala]|nr:hypothetical protein B0H13DRAFT_1176511 [Mycena leptocephala]